MSIVFLPRKQNINLFHFILFVLFAIHFGNSSKSDEDDEPRCVQLTNQHKTAIRFIRKVITFFLLFGQIKYVYKFRLCLHRTKKKNF